MVNIKSMIKSIIYNATVLGVSVMLIGQTFAQTSVALDESGVEIGEGVHHRKVHTEEFHENDQAELTVFLKARIKELERQVELQTDPPGSPTTPGGKVEGRVSSSLHRLTLY